MTAEAVAVALALWFLPIVQEQQDAIIFLLINPALG